MPICQWQMLRLLQVISRSVKASLRSVSLTCTGGCATVLRATMCLTQGRCELTGPLSTARGLQSYDCVAVDGSEDEESTDRLFLRNLPYTTTEAELSDAFAEFGDLQEVHLVLDRYCIPFKPVFANILTCCIRQPCLLCNQP